MVKIVLHLVDERFKKNKYEQINLEPKMQNESRKERRKKQSFV